MSPERLMATEATSTRDPARVVVDDGASIDVPLVPADSMLQYEQGGNAASPEQLYAAALAGCFHQSLALEADAMGTSTTETTVTATVELIPGGAEHFDLRASLAVAMPDVDAQQGERVIARAMRACPMVRGVTVELR